MALPGILPQYVPAGPSAQFMMRRGMGQAARQALATATAAGGGLAGARAGSEAAARGGMDAAYQASQLQAQEAQQEAVRRQQFNNEGSGLFRGLLSGLGGALGATGSSGGSPGQQVMGLAGSLAPLLLASDRRLKSALRGASSDDIEAVRQFILQRRGASRGPTRPATVSDGPVERAPSQPHASRGPRAGEPSTARGMQGQLDSNALSLDVLRSRMNAGRTGGARTAVELQAGLDRNEAGRARAIGQVQPRSFRGPNGPVGVIAQDVERAAPEMVRRVGPDGIRAIDIPQATSTLLAGHSDLSGRLDALESLVRGRRAGSRAASTRQSRERR